jgi:hypothetical protein
MDCASGLTRAPLRARQVSRHHAIEYRQSRRSIVASTSQTAGTHSAITRPSRAPSVPYRARAGSQRAELRASSLREARGSSLSAAFPACGLTGHPQRARDDGRPSFEQTLGARCVSAMNFESRRPTVGALAHDPRHRATIGNNGPDHGILLRSDHKKSPPVARACRYCAWGLM